MSINAGISAQVVPSLIKKCLTIEENKFKIILRRGHSMKQGGGVWLSIVFYFFTPTSHKPEEL
jgi:hypothetical protein